MKRIIRSASIAIAFALCLVCVPLTAYADEVLPDVGIDAALAQRADGAAADEAADLTSASDGVFGEAESGQVPDSEDAANEVITESETECAAENNAADESVVADEGVLEAATAEELSRDLSIQASVQSVAIASGVYTIATAVDTSKCLDVPGGSSSNAVGLQIYSKNSTPAQRWNVKALGDGLYEIINVGSGKALDVAGAVKADGTTIQQYTRNSTNAQKWKIVSNGSGYYKIVSALSDSYVLDVAGASKANGTKVQLYSDNGTKAQLWSLVSAKVVDDGLYVVKNSGSGKALDVSGGSLASGANVQQYTANGTQAQTFHMAYNSSDGYYTVTDLGSGKVLDVSGGSSSNGANVQQYVSNGTRAQKWAAVKNSDGTLTFLSSVSGLALDVSGGSSASGANVQVYESNGTKAQKWTLSTVSNWLPEGAYTIIASVNTDNVIDVSSGSTKSGANIQVYSSNGTNAQRFYLRSVGDGYYTIQNPISGLYVNVTGKASGKNVVLGTTQQQFKPVFGVGGIAFQLKDNTSLVLDISGGSTSSGANVQLYQSNGTLAQRFVVRATEMIEDGAYSIRYAANTDFVIDIPGASSADGVQANLYESNGTAAQRFQFKSVSSGTYQITAGCSGKALQLVSTGNGSYALQQKSVASSTSQQWTLVLGTDGSWQIAPKGNSNLRVDLSGGAVANCTPIIVYASNGTAAQKWKLVSANVSITYDALGLTLRTMAQLQKSSSYNDAYTVEELMDLLDPDKLEKSQFLDVRVATSVTADQLNAFIVLTSTGQSGMLKGLGSSFVSASQQYGLNEVYLLAHAILESGWGTSTLANGYYYEGGYIDGTYYPAGTYYNFYGIGAYDSSPLSGGRKLAIINGWNTPAKAVTGAAKWIANNYVYADSYAQPTLYAMKWDYARSNATGERGWHQYATSTSWPDSIARLINQCYATVGGNQTPTYVIPRYQ